MEVNFRDDPTESDSDPEYDNRPSGYDWRREKWLENRIQFISDETARVGAKAVMAAITLVHSCERRQTEKYVLLCERKESNYIAYLKQHISKYEQKLYVLECIECTTSYDNKQRRIFERELRKFKRRLQHEIDCEQ